MKLNLDYAVSEHQKVINSVVKAEQIIIEITNAMINCLENGGKVLWLGNGGSAAEAQHMSAELMVRYKKNRQPLASIALSTDTSLLTAHSNDYSFDSVFSRQIEALAIEGDMVIGMSTSGASTNVVAAMKTAQQKGCMTVSLIGMQQTVLNEISTYCINVDSTETARVQEAHTFINHLICEGLDSYY
ncbi:MAG TPA: phosphoheptose isomerase [Thiomicrospira sp.]|nr:phosphoheptose isomerase [Thiomicrospira sp.]